MGDVWSAAVPTARRSGGRLRGPGPMMSGSRWTIPRMQLVVWCFAIGCTTQSKPHTSPMSGSATTAPTVIAMPGANVGGPRRCRVPEPRARPDRAPVSGPRPCASPSPKTAQAVSAALDGSVRLERDGSDLQVHVSFGCSPLRPPLMRAWTLRVFGHGGSATILGVTRDAAGAYSAHGMRALVKESAAQSTGLLASSATVHEPAETLELVQAALTATVSVGLPNATRELCACAQSKSRAPTHSSRSISRMGAGQSCSARGRAIPGRTSPTDWRSNWL